MITLKFILHLFLNWLSGGLVGVGGSDFIGQRNEYESQMKDKFKQWTEQAKEYMGMEELHMLRTSSTMRMVRIGYVVTTPRYDAVLTIPATPRCAHAITTHRIS